MKRMSAAAVLSFAIIVVAGPAHTVGGYAGIFPLKPADAALDHNATFNTLHSASAMLAGISLTAGFVRQGMLSKPDIPKTVCFYLAAACLAFPLLMLAMPEYQGITQRLMYLQVL